MAVSSAARVMGLMQLMDSALPTGAFSHSLGFETYIGRGSITDADSFAAWLEMFVAQQLTYTDALAVRLTYRARDFSDIAELDALVTAQALPRQTREAAATMGKRLLAIADAEYPSPWITAYLESVQKGRLHGHPAVVNAIAARGLDVPDEEAVTAHLYSTVIALTQNAVRAIPLGQNSGQRIVRSLQPAVEHAVEVSAGLDPADLGAIAPGLEIAQMNHERQRARLFMS